jgi:transposase-like protein
MSDDNLFEMLGQVSSGDATQVFQNFFRGAARVMLSEVMAKEVASLCGEKHQPNDGEFFRAGSTTGRVVFQNEHETTTRPRVRKKESNGSTSEVKLSTYQSASDPQELQNSIITALMAGVSTRELKTVYPKANGTEKSNVSRLWQSAGQKFVDKLRGHSLADKNWLVVMLDGIRLSKDQLAVVAIGITVEGHKHVLDFSLGSSENTEICSDLMRRLMKRGFHCERRLFAVLDGSAALRSAINEFFPDAVIQRCLVHKERNIYAKLSNRHCAELRRLFKRLREVQGKDAADEVVKELESFLKPINAQALASLHEAGDDLTALHHLEVPNTLHRNLLSTNAIENSFKNTRRKLGRVTRFRAETNQATHWLAFALTEVEKGFRRISGWKDLPALVAALERPSLSSSSTEGSPSHQPLPSHQPSAETKG